MYVLLWGARVVVRAESTGAEGGSEMADFTGGPWVQPPTSPGGEPRGRARWLVPVVLAAIAFLVGVGWLGVNGVVELSKGSEASEGGEAPELPPSQRGGSEGGEAPELPPSQRGGGLSTTTAEGIGGSAGEAEPAGGEFEAISCIFEGSALIDPGIDLQRPPSPHSMRLSPGSSFDCDMPDGRVAGTVSMEAMFPALDAFVGSGSGTGAIEWSSPPGDDAEALAVGGTSTTSVEIELALPTIAVWTTVESGPLAGRSSRLALNDWELVQDSEGLIVEVVFAPTEASFRID